MKLYDYYRSSAAFRVRIALNIKGLEVDQESVHLRHKDQRSEAYLAVNPQGLVPALVDDDGAVVTQSLAIIEYLDETRPDTPRLLPDGAGGRARVRALSDAIACDIHPLNNLRVLRHIGEAFDVDEATRNDAWYKHWIAEGMSGFEGMLAGHSETGEFCHGDRPTMADCCLVPQIYNAERFGCDMSGYPTAMRINATCLALDAFQKALPEVQPDAEA
ncbi:MAG: maleylacetoacetate isomerase [Alphaproteobacteria bacterium]|nr:maleylacetoacetate isomerase [Alphaproteobacteria bacterium]